jgi:hypothetical protein
MKHTTQLKPRTANGYSAEYSEVQPDLVFGKARNAWIASPQQRGEYGETRSELLQKMLIQIEVLS